MRYVWLVVFALGCKARTPVEATPTAQVQQLPEFHITRAEVDALSIPKMAGMAGAAVHKAEDGSTDGFSLWSLDPLPLRMGLKNGDVVHRIGSHYLRSIAGAMGAWSTVQREDRIEVELSRRGRRQRILWVVD